MSILLLLAIGINLIGIKHGSLDGAHWFMIGVWLATLLYHLGLSYAERKLKDQLWDEYTKQDEEKLFDEITKDIGDEL